MLFSPGSRQNHHPGVPGHHHHHGAPRPARGHDGGRGLRPAPPEAPGHLLHQPPEDQHVWTAQPGLLRQGEVVVMVTEVESSD